MYARVISKYIDLEGFEGYLIYVLKKVLQLLFYPEIDPYYEQWYTQYDGKDDFE